MSISPPQLVVFSGAGLSAESGLPTFRGTDGLWEGVPIEKVCHWDTWQQNFEAVHEFYDARRQAGGKAESNPAHHTLAQWQKTWPGRVHLLTQNIDRLLERAGCEKVIHLHGDACSLRCVECEHVWEVGYQPYDRKGCPQCGRQRTVKPAVVFFGEAAPNYVKLQIWSERLRPNDTVVVVGTSGAVIRADQLFAAAYSILVNLEPGSCMREDTFQERHYGLASAILPQLTATLMERMRG